MKIKFFDEIKVEREQCLQNQILNIYYLKVLFRKLELIMIQYGIIGYFYFGKEYFGVERKLSNRFVFVGCFLGGLFKLELNYKEVF